jgi:hypothetical protein
MKKIITRKWCLFTALSSWLPIYQNGSLHLPPDTLAVSHRFQRSRTRCVVNFNISESGQNHIGGIVRLLNTLRGRAKCL